MEPLTLVSHKIDPIACPGCGTSLDGATNVFGVSKPTEGALTVCCYCGKILVFIDDGRGLKVATREDLKDAPSDVLLTLLLVSGKAKLMRHGRN